MTGCDWAQGARAVAIVSGLERKEAELQSALERHEQEHAAALTAQVVWAPCHPLHCSQAEYILPGSHSIGHKRDKSRSTLPPSQRR